MELGSDDREILAVLEAGPLTAREIAARIRRRACERWADRHGYDDIEWGDDRRGPLEPVGARLCALSEATQRDGIRSLSAHRLHHRLPALERRGAVERIQIEGRRPMLWQRRV